MIAWNDCLMIMLGNLNSWLRWVFILACITGSDSGRGSSQKLGPKQGRKAPGLLL